MKKWIAVLLSMLMLFTACGSAVLAETLPEPANYGTVTEKNPVVETQYGPVMGKSEKGVAMFRAIPYGGDVSGENRFLPASDPEPWTEVRDCTYLRARAVQSVGKSGHGNLFQEYVGDYFAGGRIGELTLNDQYDDENCLMVNVVTPGLNDGAKRPVMVYVHGGGYTEGSNAITAGAYNLAREEDVVIVGINHRLNVFGYLYLGDFDEAYWDSGNVSMRDVVKALEWVRDNIEAFGGDPENVTVFGESGGGGKMNALLLMESASGLIDKVVNISGVSSAGFKTRAQQAEQSKLVLDALGVGIDELDKLAGFTAEEIYAAYKASGASFSPMIDGKDIKGTFYDTGDALPVSIATAQNIPVMISTAEEEMKWLSGNGNRALFDITWETLPEALSSYGEDTQLIIDTYKSVYPHYDADDIYFRISTDKVFGMSAAHLADVLADNTQAPVYKYIYCHDCPIEEGIFGAYHTADLPLIFRMVMYDTDEVVSRKLAATYAAFARTGDPSTEYFQWPEYTTGDRMTVMVDDEFVAVSDPERAILDMWASIG